jgi:hypothetical protein
MTSSEGKCLIITENFYGFATHCDVEKHFDGRATCQNWTASPLNAAKA